MVKKEVDFSSFIICILYIITNILEVVYICTEDVFPSRRLKQLVEIYNARHNLNKYFQDHIYIEHVAEPKKMLECLTINLPKLMTYKNIGIIIIDSIAGIFRSENENPNYIARSKYFHDIASNLHTLQNKFNCSILITNQVKIKITKFNNFHCFFFQFLDYG